MFVDGVRLDVTSARSAPTAASWTCATGCCPDHRLRGRRGPPDPSGDVRCASMADRSCALRVEVTPENHAAEIRVHSGIDGDRRNLDRPPIYPEATVFRPADEVAEVGASQAPGGVARAETATGSISRRAPSTPASPSATPRDYLVPAPRARGLQAAAVSSSRPCTSVPPATHCGGQARRHLHVP